MNLRKPRKSGEALHLVSPCLRSLLNAAAGLILFGSTQAFADDAVQLKVLVVSTGPESGDLGLAYIRPALDEMGVPYDILDASAASLTAATLSPDGCAAATAGCVGNYNGVILTDADLGSNFTPAEWEILHQYEREFNIREAVLSGWPGWLEDQDGRYLDYGLAYTTFSTTDKPFSDTQWAGTAGGKAVFEYINTANPLPITDHAYAAIPRNDGTGPRDGTVPSIEPLLTTANGEALISIVRYYPLDQPTTPVREVLLSTITNASYLVHSQALAYEFINYVTQGVFVGGRHVYMSAHLDDLFIADELWDIGEEDNPSDGFTNPNLTYRLNSHDIANGVSAQNAFRAVHPTVGNSFKLDFPFNGAGAVLDPLATQKNLKANLSEDLVAAVVANKKQFRFINHTFSHADMDKAPESPNTPCDYDTLTTVNAIKAEITKNRKVWKLLKLPQKGSNNRILVSGNHSGLKDRNCTDIPENHPGMDNVQSDDVAFWQGVNPLFLEAASNAGVDFLAADSSQANQNVEQYISQDDDGSNQDRVMLPRWPTNVFYNVINPGQLEDEYNYIFYQRYVDKGQDPCGIPGAICTPRGYDEILVAESDTALRHMLSFRKWAHYFHQTNLADYDAGNTLQFDWLNAVFDEYERLFKLPIRNQPYFLLGDKTQETLIARSATIQATWNRATNKVTLSANKSVPNLLVTGLQGGDLYGGQFIREINVNTTPKTINVNQALTQ